MALFRNHLGKILLGIVAVMWTACSDDSSTGTDDSTSSPSQTDSSSSGDPSGSNSKPESFTRKDFINADSVITAAKQYEPTKDPCVTTKQYCQTLTGEKKSGWKDADKLVNNRAKTILDSPEAKYFPESRKSCHSRRFDFLHKHLPPEFRKD